MNSKGQFNVPMGAYANPAICQADDLRACHLALQNVDIRMRDFRNTAVQDSDFVYFDPPYHPLEGGLLYRLRAEWIR